MSAGGLYYMAGLGTLSGRFSNFSCNRARDDEIRERQQPKSQAEQLLTFTQTPCRLGGMLGSRNAIAHFAAAIHLSV